MDQQVVETPPDAFDAAIVTETTAAEPKPVVERPSNERDDKGRFASSKPIDPDEDAADAAPVETKASEKPAEKKPRNDPQARIDQAIARQRDAERRAEEAERRAQERDRELQTLRAPKQEPVKAPEPDRFPRFDDWSASHPNTTHDDYLDARDEWRDQRTAKQQAEEAQKTQHQRAFAERATEFSERLAKAIDADPGLKDRIDARHFTTKPLSLWTDQDKTEFKAYFKNDTAGGNDYLFRCSLANRWTKSEHGPAMVEWLSDPNVYQRLATLHPDDVSWELAKFEAGLAAASDKESRGSAPKPTASQAHPPIKPLGSAPRVPEADDGGDDEPIETFIRRENARDRKAGR